MGRSMQANRCNERLGKKERFPAKHADFIEQCHAAGQKRPTRSIVATVPPTTIRLHQDLHGSLQQLRATGRSGWDGRAERSPLPPVAFREATSL